MTTHRSNTENVRTIAYKRLLVTIIVVDNAVIYHLTRGAIFLTKRRFSIQIILLHVCIPQPSINMHIIF